MTTNTLSSTPPTLGEILLSSATNAQAPGRRPRRPTNLLPICRFLILDLQAWNQTCSSEGCLCHAVHSQESAWCSRYHHLLFYGGLRSCYTDRPHAVCPSAAEEHTGCFQLWETIHNAIVHGVHGSALLSMASCLGLQLNEQM